jgi:hypothetical protein
MKLAVLLVRPADGFYLPDTLEGCRYVEAFLLSIWARV